MTKQDRPLTLDETVAQSQANGDRQVIDNLETAIWVFDIDHARVALANKAACTLMQAADEAELCARDMGSDMSPTVAKRLKQYQTDFAERNAVFREMWTLYPNGEPRSVMVVFRRYVLPDGRLAMLCEAGDSRQLEPENLRSAEALLHTDVMITLFSKNGPALYMNPAARNAFDSPSMIFSNLFVDQADYADLLIQLDSTGEYRFVAEVRVHDERRWFDMSAKDCLDAATGEPAVLVTAVDVTELKTARDTARFLADRDQLTGSYNRTYLAGYYEQLSAQNPLSCCALIFIDVDRFKQLNDLFGHEMGDQALVEIANRVHASIRSDDLFARVGGDEFVVLVQNIHNDADITRRVEALRRTITQPIFCDKTTIESSVSMGVTLIQPGRVSFTEASRQADIALYASKQNGRNCATLFNEEMGRAAKLRDSTEIELKQALKNHEFVLHYQPRMSLGVGRVTSVEALVRWMHPSRGKVMPGEFIPICEETGMIEELGLQILEMGCEQAIAWARDGLDIQVSLNLSPRQFKNDRLLILLQALAQREGFPKRRVELEITESVLIGDRDEITEKLIAITKMGYRIAIDDFGTGYSNLAYISRFPVSCIKIDRSFIQQLPDSGPVVDLILTLAHQIDATVVAEGVETSDQLRWLSEHKCQEIQGFLFSPPVEKDQLFDAIHRIEAQQTTAT